MGLRGWLVQAALLGFVVLLIVVNLKHQTGCAGGDEGEESMRRRALDHRLASIEVEVRENSLILQQFLRRLEHEFAIGDELDLVALKRECHAEASAIVASLAENPPPPMPVFATEEAVEVRDDRYMDDIFRGEPDGYGEAAAAEESLATDELPEAGERAAQCSSWRLDYGVSPGASWGLLPFELQNSWKAYDCDVFIQRAANAILAPEKDPEPESEAEREGHDDRQDDRNRGEKYLEKGDDRPGATDDVVVGDVESIKAWGA
ncbi:hypothetical protein M885DRAFT_523289 [Pelagophyceae sp. CCMP2097]|nr:hypothetical protein M885DRAFT_523289 [Pelagophyceae sp. CCMP2097]|mmetsp:Transcript_18766/g.63383  ORF Transcript_18766/g.63383 Transcript_18766/m.63383 type:complete len:262 (+) Transcript_18766:68-853(+)